MRLTTCLTLALAPLFAFATSCASSEASKRPIHAMSFNIRYATPKDGTNRWQNRKDLVVRLIHERSPDLLGLQEALPRQTTYIAERLEQHELYTLGRRGPDIADEACPIFWRRDRFECLERGTFWLGEDPKRIAKAWDAALPRICSWAKLRDRETGEAFVFANTHFDHRGKKARENSAAQLAKRWPDTRVVLTGDLNAGEDSPVLDALRAGGFVDSFRAHAPDAEFVGTYCGFRVRGRRKIDFVMLQGPHRVEGAEILATQYEGRWPSDHLPVTARFTWK